MKKVQWHPLRSPTQTLKACKLARNNGAAKVGAKISAEKRSALVQVGAEKIRDRWKLPNNEWRTNDLLKEAEISRTTANKILGHRPRIQRNYQAALKRQKARAA